MRSKKRVRNRNLNKSQKGNFKGNFKGNRNRSRTRNRNRSAKKYRKSSRKHGNKKRKTMRHRGGMNVVTKETVIGYKTTGQVFKVKKKKEKGWGWSDRDLQIYRNGYIIYFVFSKSMMGIKSINSIFYVNILENVIHTKKENNKVSLTVYSMAPLKPPTKFQRLNPESKPVTKTELILKFENDTDQPKFIKLINSVNPNESVVSVKQPETHTTTTEPANIFTDHAKKIIFFQQNEQKQLKYTEFLTEFINDADFRNKIKFVLENFGENDITLPKLYNGKLTESVIYDVLILFFAISYFLHTNNIKDIVLDKITKSKIKHIINVILKIDDNLAGEYIKKFNSQGVKKQTTLNEDKYQLESFQQSPYVNTLLNSADIYMMLLLSGEGNIGNIENSIKKLIEFIINTTPHKLPKNFDQGITYSELAKQKSNNELSELKQKLNNELSKLKQKSKNDRILKELKEYQQQANDCNNYLETLGLNDKLIKLRKYLETLGTNKTLRIMNIKNLLPQDQTTGADYLTLYDEFFGLSQYEKKNDKLIENKTPGITSFKQQIIEKALTALQRT